MQYAGVGLGVVLLTCLVALIVSPRTRLVSCANLASTFCGVAWLCWRSRSVLFLRAVQCAAIVGKHRAHSLMAELDAVFSLDHPVRQFAIAAPGSSFDVLRITLFSWLPCRPQLARATALHIALSLIPR